MSAAILAAIADVRWRRIPNWITLATLVVGLAGNTWLHGLTGTLTALAGAALGIGLLLPFYALSAIGAGDVKLLGALGAALGPLAVVSVAVYGALVGGVMSAVILARHRRLLVAVNEILVAHRPLTRSGATAPYGLAIASGVVLSVVLPSVIG